MSRRLRCAIYTRKSTDEGSEQEFNSLDAQRASCEAYIQSQAGEGWTAVKARYDDGAYSGATMDRPALRRLLADIQSRKVHTVVVYKVDRLTRALADFAKMVEVFDAHGVSFVSVTQQFNTTTSMGRLTLNVLLSFAQIEREVTGERIRDKIAASKKKGMWMGGVVPLGYAVGDRKLVIEEEEAETVRALFELYATHGNVRLVKQETDRLGLRTKARNPNNGSRGGGEPFTRGHIYKLLANPIYVGEVVHKGTVYRGEHEAIIERETWDAVQGRLEHNAVKRRHGSNAKNASLLAGLLFDGDGNPMAPSHASKGGKRYRYYVSRVPENETRAAWRLPAWAIEDAVLDGLSGFLDDPLRLTGTLLPSCASPHRTERMIAAASRLKETLLQSEADGLRPLLRDLLDRIEVGREGVAIIFRSDRLFDLLGVNERRKIAPRSSSGFRLDLPVTFRRRGVGMKLVMTEAGQTPPTPDPKLIAAIAQGREWFAEIREGRARSLTELAARHGVDRADLGRALSLAFLAPEIVEAILEGRHPAGLTVSRLRRIGDLPLGWDDQRKLLGFRP